MAADINRVTLVGRLTRDAELRYVSENLAVCTMGLAVNRKRKQGDDWVEEASFFDIVLFGRLGEVISRYLTKGKQIAVDGQLRQNRWEQDGQRRSKVEIIASDLQLLGSSRSEGSDGYSSAASGGAAQSPASNPQRSPAPQSSPPPPQSSPPPSDGDNFEDDIPF